MSALLEKLKTAALAKAGDIKVSDVRIGLGYTAVLLDTGSIGLAYTFREKAATGCSVFQGKRPIAGSLVRDVVPYLCSGESCCAHLVWQRQMPFLILSMRLSSRSGW